MSTLSRRIATASSTRPANTTQYTANDVINGEHRFAKVRNSGFITDGFIISSANQTTRPQIELWLFSSPLGTYDADNAAFTPTDEELGSLIGIIEFLVPFAGDATTGAGGNVVIQAERTFLPLNYPSTDIFYGVMVVRNNYTPVSAEQFNIILKLDPIER